MLPLYRPHCIIVNLRYAKDVAILDECLAIADSACRCRHFPYREADPALKPSTKSHGFCRSSSETTNHRETLRNLVLSEYEGQFSLAREKESGNRLDQEKHFVDQW